jgi:hypothetical protein
MVDILEGMERDERAMEKLASSAERIADAIEWWVKLEQQKFDKAFPPEKVKREAELIRRDEGKTEQYSDRATDEWLAETEKAIPPSRFADRLAKTNPPEAPAKKRRGSESLPEGNGHKPRTN